MENARPTPLLDERILAVRLRPYQQEALRVLREGFRAGKRRFHVVAPPGSGKTIIGIALLQQLGLRTVILSPNAAIQAQWIDKYGKATTDIVDTFGDVWGNDTGHLISHDPAAGTPVLSLTYQRIAVRDREHGDMHGNVRELLEFFRAREYELLILDECHHLLAFWAEVLQEVLRAHPMLVLGLTATLPIGRSRSEQSAYLDLVGPVDYQIPLPAVIKDGHLAPYQDLVLLVHPDERERSFIRHRHERFHALLSELDREHPALPALALYVQDMLEAPRLRGKPLASWTLLLERHPAAAVALGRYALGHGIPLPAGVPVLDEMEDELTLDDVALLLQGYIETVCESSAGPAARRRMEDITGALRELGYDWRDGAFVRRRSQIDRILAFSSAKLAVLRRILEQEMRNLGDDVRALVLTDFETAQAGGRRAAGGALDPDAGGAVAAMRALTSHPATDLLDPVLLTGSTVLCDDDLAERFLAELRAIALRREWEIRLDARFMGDGDFQPGELAGRQDGTRGMFEITGEGRDWNTRTYVLMITELFDRGVTRCLIGTRALLGEGWDSAAANVLVDLTAVASYVSVNQMHGRSLRLDPGRPEKVANNWDVVAVLPEFERGFADWERFVRKHEQFFGLSDDGELERGIGHVHPLLTHLHPGELTAALPLINEDMLARSGRRDEVLRAWKIGLEYRGVELPCLEYRPAPGAPRRVASGARSAAMLQHRTEEFVRTRRRLSLAAVALTAPATMAAAVAVLAGAAPAPLLPVAGGAGLLTAAAAWFFRGQRLAGIRTTDEEWTQEERLLAIAAAARDALVELRAAEGQPEGVTDDRIPEVRHSVREDGGIRVWIVDVSEEESRCFAAAMSELFRPVQDQRYVLRCWRVAPGRRLREILDDGGRRPGFVSDGIVPVPTHFAGKRECATIFHQCWERHVGPADLLYARRGEGADVLRAHLRQRFLSGRRFVKVLWK